MTSTLQDIAGIELLNKFEQSGPIAHGLPAFAYNSTPYWQLENQKLFANAWVFAGFVHELATPGDAIPITIGGKPLFLVCDQKKQIRAFHNACRHRCLKLIDQTGNVGPRIRCPYHSWVYGLDGHLKSTPYFGGPEQHTAESFDKDLHGLQPVACRVWHDWVFLNLGEHPIDFDAFIKPLAKHLGTIDFEQVTPLATLDFGEVRTNWKLLMENFIEPYHVQFVHSTMTDQPLNDHYTVIDDCCLGSGVDISDPVKDGKNTLAVNSLYLTLFPNFVLGRYFPDQLGVHLNIPVGVDRTVQRRVIYTTDGKPRDEKEVEALKELWYKVHKEDHAMVERLQQGKASDVATTGGILSPYWENSVRRFQELALQAVL